MFESVNEVHDGYGKADPRHIEIVNDLDQAFVNLVRASGWQQRQAPLDRPRLQHEHR